MLRTFRGVHESRVASLSWNTSILTTGRNNGKIVNNDVSVRSHIIQTYQGHEEVNSLKWSSSGQLASGGNDNSLYIWDLSAASSNPLNQNQWLQRFEDHTSSCLGSSLVTFQSNLLASGGGDNDLCIKFWNTHTGACLKPAYWLSSMFPSLEYEREGIVKLSWIHR